VRSRHINAEKDAAKRLEEWEKQPKKDFSLKEGQTISIKIGGNASTSSSKPAAPNGKVIVLNKRNVLKCVSSTFKQPEDSVFLRHLVAHVWSRPRLHLVSPLHLGKSLPLMTLTISKRPSPIATATQTAAVAVSADGQLFDHAPLSLFYLVCVFFIKNGHTQIFWYCSAMFGATTTNQRGHEALRTTEGGASRASL